MLLDRPVTPVLNEINATFCPLLNPCPLLVIVSVVPSSVAVLFALFKTKPVPAPVPIVCFVVALNLIVSVSSNVCPTIVKSPRTIKLPVTSPDEIVVAPAKSWLTSARLVATKMPAVTALEVFRLPTVVFPVTFRVVPTVARPEVCSNLVVTAFAVIRLPAVVLPVTFRVVPTVAKSEVCSSLVDTAFAVTRLPEVVLPVTFRVVPTVADVPTDRFDPTFVNVPTDRFDPTVARPDVCSKRVVTAFAVTKLPEVVLPVTINVVPTVADVPTANDVPIVARSDA